MKHKTNCIPFGYTQPKSNTSSILETVYDDGGNGLNEMGDLLLNMAFSNMSRHI